MKKVLIALPVLAIALFFAFCAKENAKPATAAPPELKYSMPADNRGGDPCLSSITCDTPRCCINIQVTGNVRVCGLASNATACNGCYAQLVGADSGSGPFNYCVLPGALGIPFSITNPGNAAVTVTISVGGNCGVWVVSAHGCLQFNVTSTCNLLSEVAAGPC